MKGKFITIEGADGAGKSTLTEMLAQYLIHKGRNVVVTREPGGTPLGEDLRHILLSPEGEPPEPETEALIYAASRAQLIKKIILPAVLSGNTVICDRFVDSSMVYQGFARGLGINRIFEINRWFLNDCWPDITLVLDIDPFSSLHRLKGKKDRLEQEGIQFHKKVREGFLLLSKMFPERIRVVDGSQDAEEVLKAVLCELKNSHIINI
ncbi:MAG: dTMP kinase [Thermoanaerobacterales bacterium]|jgi:dTMP kinase|nr:dTMP kinase [Thermoanaerobacterales bacterium]